MDSVFSADLENREPGMMYLVVEFDNSSEFVCTMQMVRRGFSQRLAHAARSIVNACMRMIPSQTCRIKKEGAAVSYLLPLICRRYPHSCWRCFPLCSLWAPRRCRSMPCLSHSCWRCSPPCRFWTRRRRLRLSRLYSFSSSTTILWESADAGGRWQHVRGSPRVA